MLSEPSKAFLQHKEVEQGVHADSCTNVSCADGLLKRTIFSNKAGCQVDECTSRDCCIPYRNLSAYVLVATILICCFIYGTWKLENKRRKHGSIRSWLNMGPILWIEYRLGSLLFAWYILSIWLRNTTDCIFRRRRKTTTTTTTQAYESGEVSEHNIDTTRMCEADNNEPNGAQSPLPAAADGVNEKENKSIYISTSCAVLYQSKQRGRYIVQEETDAVDDLSCETRASCHGQESSSVCIRNDDDDHNISVCIDDCDEGAASVVIGSPAFKCGVNIQDKNTNLDGNSVALHSPRHSVECNDEQIATRMEADCAKTSKVKVVITGDDEKTTLAA